MYLALYHISTLPCTQAITLQFFITNQGEPEKAFPEHNDNDLEQNTLMGFLFCFYRPQQDIQSSLPQSNNASGEQQQWFQ